MRFLIVLAVCIFAYASGELYRGRTELDHHWENFKGNHGKKYKHATEESQRRKHWEANRDHITKHNEEAAAGVHTYTLKENHMADWTPEEKKTLLGFKGELPRSSFVPHEALSDFERQSLPASVDLRNHSCMTPIQDQGRCGSCWAFGATAANEFRLCMKKGTLVKLSEQHLVDCDTTNSGCGGGSPYRAMLYVKTAGGQAKLAAYPYTSGPNGTSGTCKYTSSMAGGTVTGAVMLYSPANLTDIQRQLAYNGTVAALMDVVSTFVNYGSGVYTAPPVYSETACNSNGTSVNHIVAIVGYGTQSGIPYWIIRNSWGTRWGLNGYSLIRRGSNTCNIETYISYPVV